MNKRYISRHIVIFIILFFAFSCIKNGKQDALDSDSCFLYKEKYRALYLRNCNFSEMPDSIRSKDIRQLAINSSEVVDFEALSRQIDLGKIVSIRFDDLNQSVTNLDLAKFTSLRSIGVFGGEKVEKINLINVSDSLKYSLDLHAPNLTFPQFDSAFLGLTHLSYGGNSTVIPQWIESLSLLQSFHFDTERLTEIKCDACKMENLSEFDIVDRDVEDKDLYLSQMLVYPTIQRFQECKPDLRFWNRLPPY